MSFLGAAHLRSCRTRLYYERVIVVVVRLVRIRRSGNAGSPFSCRLGSGETPGRRVHGESRPPILDAHGDHERGVGGGRRELKIEFGEEEEDEDDTSGERGTVHVGAAGATGFFFLFVGANK